MALDFPSNPTPGQVFDRWVWDGEKWVLGGDGLTARCAWTVRSFGWRVPRRQRQHRLRQLQLHLRRSARPNRIGGLFTVRRAGLYSIDYMVNWGGSAAPDVVASWLTVNSVAESLRYSSSQVIPASQNGVDDRRWGDRSP